jgi:hypothetical protein
MYKVLVKCRVTVIKHEYFCHLIPLLCCQNKKHADMTFKIVAVLFERHFKNNRKNKIEFIEKCKNSTKCEKN